MHSSVDIGWDLEIESLFRGLSTNLCDACPPIQVLEYSDPNMGYDAATAQFTDMIKAGIIDPLKVCSDWRGPGKEGGSEYSELVGRMKPRRR